MTIKEIDAQITELRRKRLALELQERNEFLKNAQTNVGRCFRVGNEYVKVLGVPKVEQCITGESFNQYQYPAIYLTKDEVPFAIDTLFSAAWDVGYDMQHDYKEITQEEFNIEFDKALKEFSDRIKKIG